MECWNFDLLFRISVRPATPDTMADVWKNKREIANNN